ncbi:hypothetical protein SUGI_0639590 [Cryptomeria japonica]|nr:hypothetical protein SUGI_0639590 [Cryptomeria japonica]
MRFEKFFCHGCRRHHNSGDGTQTEKHNGSVSPCQRRKRLMRKVSQEMETSYDRPWKWSRRQFQSATIPPQLIEEAAEEEENPKANSDGLFEGFHATEKRKSCKAAMNGNPEANAYNSCSVTIKYQYTVT